MGFCWAAGPGVGAAWIVEQTVDQFGALVGSVVLEELDGLLITWDGAGEVEINTAQELGVIGERRGRDLLALPGGLLVRTGGERRVSNFLLWNLAYAELYFTDVLWPEFSTADLDGALEFFAQRERRFGKTSAQVAAKADA